jgi:hypothetical protein
MKKIIFLAVIMLLAGSGYGQKPSTPSKTTAQTSCSLWRELYDPNFNKDNTVLVRICKDAKLGYVMDYTLTYDLQNGTDPKPLIKKIVNGKTRYIDKDNPEQYFVVEKNGDLSAYDNYGFIETYKKYE